MYHMKECHVSEQELGQPCWEVIFIFAEVVGQIPATASSSSSSSSSASSASSSSSSSSAPAGVCLKIILPATGGWKHAKMISLQIDVLQEPKECGKAGWKTGCWAGGKAGKAGSHGPVRCGGFKERKASSHGRLCQRGGFKQGFVSQLNYEDRGRTGTVHWQMEVAMMCLYMPECNPSISRCTCVIYASLAYLVYAVLTWGS